MSAWGASTNRAPPSFTPETNDAGPAMAPKSEANHSRDLSQRMVTLSAIASSPQSATIQ